MTAKQVAQSALETLPDDATADDIQYHLWVAQLVNERSAKLEEALKDGLNAALASGKLISHHQVKRTIFKA